MCAASEPASLRKLGTYSALCEQNGVDFLFPNAEGVFCGIQRKRVDDLVASVRGDRIARELGQCGDLATTILLVEGDWRWDSAGYSGRVRGFTRAQFDGLMLAFQAEGWWVLHSTSLQDTARLIAQTVAWFAKGSHGSLTRRPKPRRDGQWGQNGHRATQIHALQCVDGWGPGLCATVVDHLGFPLALTCTDEELLAVPGMGPGRVKKARELFG